MTQEAPSSFIEDLKKEQHAIRSQDNTDASERSEDPLKFIVGTVLTFQSYSPDEVATLGKDHKYTFQRGDRLVVDEKNNCGMGIDVTRIRDGKRDMVWPRKSLWLGTRRWRHDLGKRTRSVVDSHPFQVEGVMRYISIVTDCLYISVTTIDDRLIFTCRKRLSRKMPTSCSTFEPLISTRVLARPFD